MTGQAITDREIPTRMAEVGLVVRLLEGRPAQAKIEACPRLMTIDKVNDAANSASHAIDCDQIATPEHPGSAILHIEEVLLSEIWCVA